MKLTNLLSVVAVLTLGACGGGGESTFTTPTSQALGKYSVEEQNKAAEILDTPPKEGVRQSTADLKRLREARLEKWKEGDALTPAVIPEGKLAVKPPPKEGRKGALAVGDPVQRAMGETVAVAPTPTSIPADASSRGMWSQVYNWPLIPIHMGMLPDGRLMSFGTTETGRQTGSSIYAIFDPAEGLFDGHMVLPNGTITDIFCSAMLFLPLTNEMATFGGDVYRDGWAQNIGNNNTTIFTPGTNVLAQGKNMFLPRWYATTTTLLNGSTFIQGGLGGEAYPEVRDGAGNFRALTGANTRALDYWYPRNFLNSDGRIFGYDSYGNYYYVTTTGTGQITIAGQWDANNFGEAGSAAMFRPGLILQLAAFTNRAAVIDIRTNNAPTLTQTQPMNTRRQNVNASVLPDGKVVATGGSVVYNETGPNAGNNNSAAIWNPDTGTWMIGPDGTMPRLYHSINMLMPDGTVLVGGGGAWGPLSNTNVEFYYPPYLFSPSGGLATRPVVTAAPTTMEVGGTFRLTVSDAQAPITRVTMIKTGVTTHSLNMEQNFNELSFTRSGNELTVQLPSRATDATPGYYMVFALTASGTPSQARIIRLNVPALAIPAPTAVTATYSAGSGVTIRWTQSSSVAVTHNIILRGTSSTGPFTQLARIPKNTSYTDPLQTTGTYYYVVRAEDTNQKVSANSTSSMVSIGTPPPGVAPGAPTGATASYTVGTGVSISWTNPTNAPVTQNIIQRATSSSGPFSQIAQTGEARSSYVDPISTAGTYYYRVSAQNDSGTSAFSNVASATVTSGGTATLAAPTGLSAYTCGAGCWTTDTGIRFNWTQSASGNISTNTIFRNTTGVNGAWTEVARIPASTVYVDKNIVSGTTYYYRVVANRADGSFSTPATLSYGVTANITLSQTPPPPPPSDGFAIESQGETRYLVMNWWRGDPAQEGNYRQPGICTGPTTTGGNCYLGARKTFRPIGFNIATTANGNPASVAGLIMMDVPQYEGGIRTYDHYKLPVEFVKNGCSFSVRHVRTHTSLEFPLNPPGLEILPHSFTLTTSLCDSYPTGAMTQSWLDSLNAQLTSYLGPRPTYNPIAYPYSDPRTGRDPSQP